MGQRDSVRNHKLRTRRNKPQFPGWKTTDAEEIERRRLRALAEPFSIKALEPDNPVFGTFLVQSRNGSGDGAGHVVEIRSLEESRNSCSCPDYFVNGLGTCKHIEATLDRRARRRRAARNGASRSSRAEIFLSRQNRSEIRVLWPERTPRAVGRVLDPFFSGGGVFIGPPVSRFPLLVQAINGAPKRVRDSVRIARDVEPWIENLRRADEREVFKRQFLADVDAGRRTPNCVKTPLYPYQVDGMLHLAFGERALLADEMGLGKTVQAIAACELLRQTRGVERVLVVSPASLKAEWQEQIGQFTDLEVRPIWGPRPERLRALRRPSFFYLANYEQIRNDVEDINTILAPDVVILDEAQRIKNWQTATAGAVKKLQSRYAFVLTGTPLENRIDEVYSIFQFLDPQVLGPLFRFNREFYALDERGRPIGYKNLDELHRRIRPLMLRRRKTEVEDQLPKRTVNNYFVAMDGEQRMRYEEYQTRVARLLAAAKRRPLTREEMDRLQQWLACMRMICDTPFILDADCRVCPKLGELKAVLEEVFQDRHTKVLVFSEWERMLQLVRPVVETMDAGIAWHTGSVPQKRRAEEVRRFKTDPECRAFLSTDAGSVGLNLQAASVVINLDLPWNPARLEQRIARAWRKHQARAVTVINLVTLDTIEHRMLGLLQQKQELADEVVDGRGRVRSIALRSGRAAMVDRLEALMGPESEKSGPPELSPTGSDRSQGTGADAYMELAEKLRVQLGHQILLLEQRIGHSGTPSLIAVVEPPAAPSKTVIEETVKAVFGIGPKAPRLEVFDRTTHETILRLTEAGILTANGTPARRHLESPALTADPRVREEQRRRAREALERADRKLRMASLLRESGFAVESLLSLNDAMEHTLASLCAVAGAEVEGESTGRLTPDFIQSRLIGPGFLPDSTAGPIARLRELACGEGPGNEDVPLLFDSVRNIYRTAARRLDY